MALMLMSRCYGSFGVFGLLGKRRGRRGRVVGQKQICFVNFQG